jgi:hypothetical protein
MTSAGVAGEVVESASGSADSSIQKSPVERSSMAEPKSWPARCRPAVVGPGGVEHGSVRTGAGGDDAGDLALDDALGGGGVSIWSQRATFWRRAAAWRDRGRRRVRHAAQG